MSIQTGSFRLLRLINIFILVAGIAYQVNGFEARQLDESTGDQGVKCTQSCIQSPPPPSPPPPCPPPPALPPPPPTPKKPPTKYCPPPPPPPSFIYITGPPGNLYPVDSDFTSDSRKISANFPVLIGCGLLGLLAFW